MTHKELISCPSCLHKANLELLYQIRNTPVHQNVIYDAFDGAINCRRGELSLLYCHNCGIIFNSQFRSELLEYGEQYNNKQSVSEYFKSYLQDSVELLIQKYEIINKIIVDVGCGNGEFLELLSRKSHSKGIGFDPSYVGPSQTSNAHFISDYLTEKYSPLRADVLIFRHVLEHIDKPNQFLSTILKYLHIDGDCKIIIEVPDFDWIVEQGSYWDIFYEHVNYFSKQSLRNLLESIGLNVIDIFNQFNGQYMVAIASYEPCNISKNDVNIKFSTNCSMIEIFKRNIEKKNDEVGKIINQFEANSLFTIWGAAAKGVTFLNCLNSDIQKRIPFVIDINEAKHGKYCAGVGVKIMPPAILKQRMDVKNIIVMNPNYIQEIPVFLPKNNIFNLVSI